MTAKHPWMVTDAPNQNPHYPFLIHNGEGYIAIVHNKENARLVAAAPQLMEALAEIEAQYSLLLQHTLEDRHAHLVDQSPVLMKARSALARAQSADDQTHER